MGWYWKQISSGTLICPRKTPIDGIHSWDVFTNTDYGIFWFSRYIRAIIISLKWPSTNWNNVYRFGLWHWGRQAVSASLPPFPPPMVQKRAASNKTLLPASCALVDSVPSQQQFGIKIPEKAIVAFSLRLRFWANSQTTSKAWFSWHRLILCWLAECFRLVHHSTNSIHWRYSYYKRYVNLTSLCTSSSQ